MSGCCAATVNRCDRRVDFYACPCCGYSVAGEPFGAYPYSGYSTVGEEPFCRLPLPRVERRESSVLLYIEQVVTQRANVQWSEEASVARTADQRRRSLRRARVGRMDGWIHPMATVVR